MNDETKPDSGLFRFIIGLIAMATAVGGFAALFVVKIPGGNENALMFALGAVFQWAAGVVASEYGASTTGRKVAEQVVRTMERQSVASEQTPAPVTVVNASDNPVPTKDQSDANP